MILKLKKGKGSDIIRTIDGGVSFIEGEETRIDSTRIVKEELARIQSDYDVIENLHKEPKPDKQAGKPQKPDKQAGNADQDNPEGKDQ